MRDGRQVNVNLGSRSYAINIGRRLEDTLTTAPAYPSAGAFIVTDRHVAAHWLDACRGRLERLGYRVGEAVIEPGEASKNWAQAGLLVEQAVEAGLDRSGVVVALGGGVAGDLGGFVAGTLLRGVGLIQVPTSLLAMVDSSVGGKTGVNLPQGKNLAGVFYQPREVAIALEVLGSLPDREYRSGLAEVVKYGLIWDAPFFKQLGAQADALLARDPEALEAAIGRSCEIKAEVVGLDERESGVRAILNFGHTLGHAIETAAGYGTLLHGEAIAIGMVYAARLSEAHREADAGLSEQVCALLTRFGLPVSFASADLVPPPWSRIRELMAGDKKSRNRSPRFVLLERMGGAVFGCELPEAALESVYQSL